MDNHKPPESLNLAAQLANEGMIDVKVSYWANVVGLAMNQDKRLLWRHERMPINATLLSNIDLVERLGGCLENAERAAGALTYRIQRVTRLYLSPGCESPGGRKPDPADVVNMLKSIDPRPAYWSRLEEHFFTLLESLPNDWDATTGDSKPDEEQMARLTWRQNIKREAKRALLESIESLGTTARAIQAIARVPTDFYDIDLDQQSAGKSKKKEKGGT
jgi:CRISPR system Cascade subunit CasA